MTKIELDKHYDHKIVESKLYNWWEESGFFKPKASNQGKTPFVITLPPPNITGDLHLGHAATFTISDIFGRYHRMKGHPTLLLPGTDHAAIAAQVTVEKKLSKEGLGRYELGRTKFLEKMWDFINTYQPRITSQIRRIGVSADWSREHFTMDPQLTKAVRQFFKDLQDNDLLYQDNYITTWCPRCQTVLSDLENVRREEAGQLWFINYGPLTVATTRPETMLGDTGVAVHPDDKRYHQLIGTKVRLPLTNREIPIISDAAVDPMFGTGAVKVTPGHSEIDYEIGQRHQLPTVAVIDLNGRINDRGGPYQGLKIKEARAKIIEDLKNKGLIVKTTEHSSAVGHCERCDTITEEQVTKQWFVRMQPLAEKALQAAKSGQLRFIPAAQGKVFIHWLEHIHDWAISRQLWWGHPIPVDGETDTLDTWFSSALWPFATLGWPDQTDDLKQYFPTSMIVTARDIIFFWVARMVMSSLFEMKELPFTTVYFNPMVLDEHGQKMSKTKGNVLDPLELADKYGMDALRMSLIIGAPADANVRLSEQKIIAQRNFANKIWNSARYILSYDGPTEINRNAADEKFLEQLADFEKEIDQIIGRHRIHDAAEKLYDFYWHEFCDLYLESTKNRRHETQEVLVEALERQLKLLHPFMPYLTEEIWQKLHPQQPLMLERWPVV